MKLTKLDARLEAAASLVKRGAVVADIGSDHAYLPIYLCRQEIISSAIASDVNQGPVDNAIRNIKDNCLENKITAVCANGLNGLENYVFDTVCVCGMGGELIFDIINCELVKSKKPELILQPMSSLHDLSFLMASNGFAIDNDLLVREGSKIYRVMKAVYTGKSYSLSLLEACVGKINLSRADSITLDYIRKIKNNIGNIILSKKYGNSDISQELLLENEINLYMKKLGVL